jgi:intracellular septation protein
MKQALRQLMSDFLSAFLFVAVYALSRNLVTAAAIAVGGGVARVVFLCRTRRRIDAMQWLSLALVIVLGGATMLTQSPRFLMLKPTIIHLAVAATMLRRGWMLRYLPEIVSQNVPESAIAAAGYSWATLIAALGLTNLVIAVNFDFMTWAWFISLGSVGSKLALFGLQYAVFRVFVRQRLAPSTAVGPTDLSGAPAQLPP